MAWPIKAGGREGGWEPKRFVRNPQDPTGVVVIVPWYIVLSYWTQVDDKYSYITCISSHSLTPRQAICVVLQAGAERQDNMMMKRFLVISLLMTSAGAAARITVQTRRFFLFLRHFSFLFTSPSVHSAGCWC